MARTVTYILQNFVFICSLLALPPSAHAQTASAPVHIPLTVSQTRAGTYKANINIGIGNMQPAPFAFDTGSTGLHAFAAARLDAPNSGVQCSQTPVSFTVGNPGRVTYSGVVCYAPLHFDTYTTPVSVPIAYLTSASCTDANPNCKIPDLNNPKAHGGVYGVFGAGLTGAMPIPAPLLTLPAPYSTYSIRLTRRDGELVLGAGAPPNAARFPLVPGKHEGVKWDKGQTCLFVNKQATGTCLAISFDTGNGMPWIRAADTASIPQEDGLVAQGTRIGFAPPGAVSPATALVAGEARGNRIKLQPAKGAPLTNVGIEAFVNHIVTYDNENGMIYVAPGSGQN